MLISEEYSQNVQINLLSVKQIHTAIKFSANSLSAPRGNTRYKT